jgi:hypothetical protein
VGSGPEELEQEILLARDQLRRDVEELVARVSPRAVAHRQVEGLQHRAGRVVPNLRIARDEVLSRPAVLVAGAAVLALSLVTVVWRARRR